jgi:adenylate cyclase
VQSYRRQDGPAALNGVQGLLAKSYSDDVAGPLCIPFRAVGIRPSRMNPNTCTFCELMFTRVMKARNITIDATVLFVDLRGYTATSQLLAPDQMSSTLDAFYDECAEAIWERDG